MCWESEDPFSVNSYEFEYPKNNKSGNIYESGKISSSVNLVLLSYLQRVYSHTPGKHSARLSVPSAGKLGCVST